MTEGVKQAFLMEREFQSQAEISSKSRVDGYDDFIFVNRYGDVQNQGNLNKALRRMMRDCNDEILEKYGADSDPVLLPQFSCHILRHTFATRLCESGANLKFIQSILGHADVYAQCGGHFCLRKTLASANILDVHRHDLLPIYYIKLYYRNGMRYITVSVNGSLTRYRFGSIIFHRGKCFASLRTISECGGIHEPKRNTSQSQTQSTRGI